MENTLTLGNRLNLGCGFNKMEGYINVDKYDICEPDVVVDLDKFPWPWPDHSIDQIFASHVMEHLIDWWAAVNECARILKVGGIMEIRVPDESSSSALSYRDHNHVFSWFSFYGVRYTADSIIRLRPGYNAWAQTEWGKLPLIITGYAQVPDEKYLWMAKWCPRILRFCADHLRNFIREQRISFQKIEGMNYDFTQVKDRGNK